MAMRLYSFLGVLDLGFGIILMTAVIATTMVCTNLTNLSDVWQPSVKVSIYVIMAFTTSSVGIWAYASYGAFNHNVYPAIITYALYQWTLFVFVWIIISVLSTTSAKHIFCTDGNCPSSIWLYNSSWYLEPKSPGSMNLQELKADSRDTATVAGDFRRSRNALPRIDDDGPISLPSHLKKPKFENYNINKLVILFNSAFWMVIFGYGWMVLYSYDVELKSRSGCEQNEEYDVKEVPCEV